MPTDLRVGFPRGWTRKPQVLVTNGLIQRTAPAEGGTIRAHIPGYIRLLAHLSCWGPQSRPKNGVRWGEALRLGPLRLDFGTFFAHGIRAIAHLDASPHPTRLTFSTPQTPPMGPYAMVLAYWDVLGLFLYGRREAPRTDS